MENLKLVAERLSQQLIVEKAVEIQIKTLTEQITEADVAVAGSWTAIDNWRAAWSTARTLVKTLDDLCALANANRTKTFETGES